jgi:hypothetical protein
MRSTLVKRWTVVHVKRGANFLDHGLAKYALQEPIYKVWMEEIPRSIHDTVTLEQYAFSI